MNADKYESDPPCGDALYFTILWHRVMAVSHGHFLPVAADLQNIIGMPLPSLDCCTDTCFIQCTAIKSSSDRSMLRRNYILLQCAETLSWKPPFVFYSSKPCKSLYEYAVDLLARNTPLGRWFLSSSERRADCECRRG